MSSPAHRPPASSLSIPHEQAQSAALKGASLAFQKQLDAKKPSPGPKPTDHLGGALVAATSAASLSNQTTGGSSVADPGVPEYATLSSRLAQLQQRSGSPHLRPPGPAGGPRSASFIAATLAASRSTSPSPSRKNSVVTPQGQRRRARAHSGASSVGSLQLTSPSNLGPGLGQNVDLGYDGEVDADLDQDEEVDFRRLGRRKIVTETPTLPAREQTARRDGDPVKSPSPVRDMEVAGQRRKVINQVPEQEEPESPVQKPRPKPKSKPKPKLDSITNTKPRAVPEPVDPETIVPGLGSEPISPSVKRASGTQPKPKGTRTQPARTPIKAYDSEKDIQVLSEVIVPKDVDDVDCGSLTLDGTHTAPFRERVDSISSDDTFFSTSSGHARDAPTPPPPRRSRSVREIQRRPQSAGAPASSEPRPASSLSRQTPAGGNRSNLALDSLTNAIMASSLASARHTPSSRSQTPAPVPVPGRKRNDRLVPNSTGGQSRSHSRSPPKKHGMLTTLRAPQSKSDDEEARKYRERHRKRGSLGSKKHVHHEGSRRRWRDSVTAEERRRYEALWASNRGLLLPPKHGGGQQQQPEDLVANVVVRDLWSRSRLPHDELAEVWDLVDLGRRGSLSKEEFVVGMWLIDMRLRGRKIPPRVSQSVWDSVKGLRVPAPA